MPLHRQYVFEEMGRRYAHAFLEDSYGFVWIGGTSLHRFDGYKISSYSCVDTLGSAVAMGMVNALLEDRQHRIWIGSNQGLFRFDRATDSFIQYYYNGEKENASVPFGPIMSLKEDNAGRIWIGDREHLFVMEDPEKGKIQRISEIDIGPKYQNQTAFSKILESSSGDIYAASNLGLWEIRPDLTSRNLVPPAYRDIPDRFYILDMVHGANDDLWLGTTEGLWIFNTYQKTFHPVELLEISGLVVQALLFEPDQSLWLGTKSNGLYRYQDGVLNHYQHDPDNQNSVSDNDIRALLKDRFGNLWVGTMFSVCRANFTAQCFPFYQVDPGPYNFDNCAYRLMQDSSGGLWFRLLRLGLGYSPGLGENCEVIFQPEMNSNIEEIKDFAQDTDGNVWVLTLTNGLFKFMPGSKIPEPIELGDSIRHAIPLTLITDQIDGRYLWFSSRYGLCRVDRFTHKTKWFSPKTDLDIRQSQIGSMVQATNGKIWMTIRIDRDPRLAFFDPKTGHFSTEFDNPLHSSAIAGERLLNLAATSDGKIWVGTRNGVIIFDSDNGAFIRLKPDNGFPLRTVYAITQDLQGDIWFTGDRSKICRFNGSSYQCYDGRKDIESFNIKSVALGRDGKVTFGGTNGIYSFHPEDIVFDTDTVRPQVILSNFKVFNEKRRLGPALELVENIELPYEENVFTFEFTSLHYRRTEEITYRYRMLGFKDYWVKVERGDRTATFTNLDPGNYTFEVVAETADSLVSNQEEKLLIHLKIAPPWYRTGWAYAVYITLSGFLLYTFRKYDLRRQIARSEARQLRELDTFKSRFYTNITHEFRTPITLIEGMANQILRQPDHKLEEGIALIKQNNQRLSQLVEQLLDLSKLESGTLQLNLVQADVITYLQKISQPFCFYAEEKGIELRFRSRPAQLFMDYDPDKLMDVVSNLLGNAIKFTPEGGTVYFELNTVFKDRAEHLLIRIRDTGIGIEQKNLPFIFERFYQVDTSATRKGEGAGIGLALTRELVGLMHGEINVESEINRGTLFNVLLPITRQAPFEHSGTPRPTKLDLPAEAKIHPFIPKPHNGHNDKPRLLIVEDTPDVIYYLTQLLTDQYQIISAVNGQEGIDLAITSVPDIIISDVMMPKKDGLELCATLKEDPRTSHIPIILLTAKADTEARITGLQRGADAYLAKPFIEAELKTRLQKLIELRARLQARYAANGADAPLPEPGFEMEDEFIQKVRSEVEARLDDDGLTIAQLAEQLNMNRVQLFRKIKALTGQSPSRLIRSIRLKHAQKMLSNTQLTVAEIAYQVGFSDPAFFSRTFREAYDQSPSEFRQGLHP